MTDVAVPVDALVRSFQVYAQSHDLRRVAARAGAQRPGYRLSALRNDEVARLLADRLQEHVAAGETALRQMLKTSRGDHERAAGLDLETLRGRIAQPRSAADAAQWVWQLWLDTRPDARALAATVVFPSMPPPATVAGAPRKTPSQPAGGERSAPDRDARRVAERAARRRELASLRRRLAREIDLRKEAEADASGLRARLREVEQDLAARREEVTGLHRAMRERESPGSARDLRRLRREVSELRDALEEQRAGYAALVQRLRGLEERMVREWARNKLEEKHLRPSRRPAPEPVPEPPRREDHRPPTEKVRMPATSHHWPGGEGRFRKLLERVAALPQVSRVVPRRFQNTSRSSGVGFITPEGDLVVRITAGGFAAQVLVLTTATGPAQGAFVREKVAEILTKARLID